MPKFNNKVVVVTGASSGIGKATAQAFAREGADVVLAARSKEGLTSVLDNLTGKSIAMSADVTNESDRERLIKDTIEAFGRLDILVNAAGILTTGTIENTTIESWDEMFEINVRSIFRLIQISLPHLIESRGNIVNVSSVTGIRAFPGVLAYCVSKAAVDQLTRCISLELAPKGVRINAVNPGVTRTQLHKRGGMSEEKYEEFLKHSAEITHPLGRIGEPEEIADLILFLASENASWITGATCPIDGGRSNTCLR